MAARLRPLKVARLVLPDDDGDVRLQGTVAWAIAVPSGGSIQYRAGVEFVNAEKKQLTTYCEKYGGTPDPTTPPPSPKMRTVIARAVYTTLTTGAS